MQEGTLVRWVRNEGEDIKKGDVLAEIETDKATVEVESSASGVVRRLLVDQVTAPVRWAQSMAALAELGCVRAFEIGPGQVLTRLVQRMRLGIEASAAGEGEGWAALASVA